MSHGQSLLCGRRRIKGRKPFYLEDLVAEKDNSVSSSLSPGVA